MSSFSDECCKLALSMSGALSTAKNLSGAIGTLGAAGGAAGGALGAGIGGYRNYQQAKQQGLTGSDATRAALSGAFKGGLIGAGTGILAGGAGGAALGHLSPSTTEKVISMGRNLPGGAYGQGLAHTFTGWKPKEGLGVLGLGAAPARKSYEEAVASRLALEGERAKQLANPNYVPGHQQGVVGSLRARVFGAEGDTARRLSAATSTENRLGKALGHAQTAERMDLTNIPGYLKAMAGHSPTGGGAIDALKASLGQRWHSASGVNKALMFGLPVAMGAQEMIHNDPNDPRGQKEKALSALGTTAGALAFAPMSMTGEMLMGAGLQKGLAGGGRVLDKLQTHNALTTADRAEEATAGAGGSPVERIETPRYRGEAPEGVS